MSKKEIKISNVEMMELMELRRTSDSNEYSDKTAIKQAANELKTKAKSIQAKQEHTKDNPNKKSRQ